MHTPSFEAPAVRASAATYAGSAEHVRVVRADMRVLLHDCPIADDVILCASELAANASTHSHSRLPGGQFTVRAEIRPGDFVRIDVEDDGGLWTEAAHDPDRVHGLDIIRALASEWGIKGDQPAAPSGHAPTGRAHERHRAQSGPARPWAIGHPAASHPAVCFGQ